MDPLVEPCAFVSVPVALFALLAVEVVAVPCAFACVPAVEPVVSTVPDVPSFDEVRVLLLLLQPKTSAATSARPYADFIFCFLMDVSRRFLWGRRRTRRAI